MQELERQVHVSSSSSSSGNNDGQKDYSSSTAWLCASDTDVDELFSATGLKETHRKERRGGTSLRGLFTLLYLSCVNFHSFHVQRVIRNFWLG